MRCVADRPSAAPHPGVVASVRRPGVRIGHLGFEVRGEHVLEDGSQASAQVTRDEVDALDLRDGQIVFVRPTRTTVFGPH